MKIKRLIIFTRYPEPGKTKTRLIPALGKNGAAGVHKELVLQTLIKARQLAMRSPVSLEINFTGGDETMMKRWLGPDLCYRHQRGAHLGEKMFNAFVDSNAEGYSQIVLIGTDVPDITIDILHSAFTSLENKDIVFGPAHDGGYYLVGLKRPVAEIFEGISWGSHEVLKYTLIKTESLGLSTQLLTQLHDVDRPEDLRNRQDLFRSDGSKALEHGISVIIPAFNEDNNIADALSSAAASECAEIIVADGGSGDMTIDVALSYGAKVVVSEPGRAVQQNSAVEKASGDILLFLHADTVLPENFDYHIRFALSENNIVAGAFLLSIDDDSQWFRIICRLANWRARRLKMPYGDQGIFVKTSVFKKLGGFPEMPLMEDYELIRRLKRCGRIIMLPYYVRTSHRRWKRLGIVKTTCINQLIIIGYHLGVTPERLSRIYRSK